MLLEQNPSRLLRSISNRIRKVFFSVFLSRFALSSVYHIPSSWTTDEHFSKSRSVFLNVFRFHFLFVLWRHWRIGMGSADPISFVLVLREHARRFIYYKKVQYRSGLFVPSAFRRNYTTLPYSSPYSAVYHTSKSGHVSLIDPKYPVVAPRGWEYL